MGANAETEEDEILDNGSTVSLMKDKDKVVDIMNRDVNVLMSTNAGKKVIKQEATRKGYGKVLYDEGAVTNLRSLSEMVKRGYQVVMDTAVENAFLVTSPEGITTKYACNRKGLYALVEDEECHQLEGFTQREIARAKRAKKLYYDLDTPTLEDLKVWLRSN